MKVTKKQSNVTVMSLKTELPLTNTTLSRRMNCYGGKNADKMKKPGALLIAGDFVHRLGETRFPSRWKPRISFGLKLTSIVTLILLSSIWIITSLMDFMVSSEFARNADETNFDINSRAAAGVRDRIYKVRSEALLLLDMDALYKDSSSQVLQIRNIFFERNPNIAAVIIQGFEEIINQPFFRNNAIQPDQLIRWLMGEEDAITKANTGVPVIKNASPALGINLLALFYPWQNTGFENAAVIFFTPENLSEISSAGSSSTIVINGNADILVHPDFSLILAGGNISDSPVVEALNKAPGDNVRLNYTEEGKRYVAAGHRIPFADTAVFSIMEYSLVTEQITAVTRRNIYLSVTVMFFTFLITWFFSKSITNQLKRLRAAAVKIGMGEFDTGLKPGKKDELGDLTSQIIEMSKGLNSFMNARSLVGRYNNREILSKTIQGGIKLRGEYIDSVILSINFITYDEIGGKLEAGESLELLNDFIQRISENVKKTSGVVDRIIGSRLIALWGVPLSSGEITDDIMNCLRSVISMRTDFFDFNTERESKGLPLYRMSCGIHTGKVLAGSIGTPNAYQYLVMGSVIDEAVMAADACVPAKIDIIVTDAVRTISGNNILTEKLPSSRQDKNKPPIYGLVNLTPREHEMQRWPFTLSDIREYMGKITFAQRTLKDATSSAE